MLNPELNHVGYAVRIFWEFDSAEDFEKRYAMRTLHDYAPYWFHFITGTVEMEFFGEPSITLSL
jgi:hypothetical protein